MKRHWRKGLAGAVVAFALLLLAGKAVSLLVRDPNVSRRITARLSASFGRSVEVGGYSFSLWEGPQLEADSVTVEEAPQFGREYFLRADSVFMRLHWTALLRGRFEFASFSLSHPSLNVVNAGGRWNLENWLPTVAPHAGRAGENAAARPGLYRIQISAGRINFKRGLDTLPFALVDVNGSVDERAPGRWALSLEAQPMRVAVNLQEAGTIRLSGLVGGTSVRLRPASLALTWPDASLPDVLRLAFGSDYGVRGRQDLELRATSRGREWEFEADAQARGMHRWDQVAEPGDPALKVHLAGSWLPGEGKLDLTDSRISGSASLVSLGGSIAWPVASAAHALAFPSTPRLQLDFTSSGVGAQDLLAWYRSFHQGISPALRASGWLGGSLVLAGWPPRVSEAVITSDGLRVAGGELPSPIDLAGANLTVSRGRASLRVPSLDGGPRTGQFQLAGSAAGGGPWKFRLEARGSTPNLGLLARAAQVLGARLPASWTEFGGSAALQLAWTGSSRPFHLTSHATLDLRDAVWREQSLPARVRFTSARVEVSGGRLRIRVGQATALGADWRGRIERFLPAGPWSFDLAADRLDLRALAARFKPQPSRPSLLERIFGFGHAQGSAPLWPASLNAVGALRVARLEVPPISLRDVGGTLLIRDGRLEFSRARGHFYGGLISGRLDFSASGRVPAWRLSAHLVAANLAELSLGLDPAETPARFSGRASGALDAYAQGASVATLRDTLDGEANIAISGARDRRVDWLATLEQGHAVAGASAFREVTARLRLVSGKLTFEKLALSSPPNTLQAAGTLDLARGGALAVEARLLLSGCTRPGHTPSAGRTYDVTGAISTPRARLRPSSLAAPAPASH